MLVKSFKIQYVHFNTNLFMFKLIKSFKIQYVHFSSNLFMLMLLVLIQKTNLPWCLFPSAAISPSVLLRSAARYQDMILTLHWLIDHNATTELQFLWDLAEMAHQQESVCLLTSSHFDFCCCV